MIEYKQRATAAGKDFFDESRASSAAPHDGGGKLSLTKLWEVIVRTKRLPDGFDEQLLFTLVRDRLRDPEREVRQHALRVLSDLIPVTQPNKLDDQMRPLIPEVLTNLGHAAPALRKGALDSLRTYFKHTPNCDQLLKELITAKSEDATVLAAAPYLVNANTEEKTLKFIINQLWTGAGNQGKNQETAVKSLARIRTSLGDDKFKFLMEAEPFKELQAMCDSFGLPSDYFDASSSDGEKTLWSSEEVEDKVILETEITLRTGPAITMKIHEESRPSSVVDGADSEEDPRQEMGVVRILEDDSESDYYESARRTPRKVRFGGEIVKMRTPESDSNNEGSPDTDDHQHHTSMVHITVTDAISIKTKRSLIPVRITSLPSTPRKKTKTSKRLHKSTPNLTKITNPQSKIPLRRTNSVVEKSGNNNKTNNNKNIITNEAPKLEVKPEEAPTVVEDKPLTAPKPMKDVPILPVRRNSRADDVLSPIPIHNEIEVFHNLTRSPERQLSNESTTPNTQETVIEDLKTITYNSFQVCHEKEDLVENKENKETIVEKVITNVAVVENGKELLAPEPIKEVQKVEGAGSERQLQIVKKINGEQEPWAKSEALDSLNKVLKEPNICETLEPGPATLFFEALFACHHKDRLHTLADEALALLVSNLRPAVLQQCLRRLALGLCRMGAPSGVKIALIALKRCPAKKLQQEILEHCFGHRTREGALQILMATARLLPSNEVEVQKIAEFAANALRDRRRRVRHAALENLATLAQLRSNSDILEIVDDVIGHAADHEQLMCVVRTRLSRKQLPTVELDGTIRYSSPRDQTEADWLSSSNSVRHSNSPTSSSSSNTPSINYWRHNSRHEDNPPQDLVVQSYKIEEDSNHGNEQPIWAVDPSFFPKANGSKGSSKVANLRPVYILQPQDVHEFRGHRRYDRGRSFSPPKPHQHKSSQHQQIHEGVVGSAPLNTYPNRAKPVKFDDGFRKSFSSEQLYSSEKHHEPYSFSLSSRSSTTSTGSSTRSGIWLRDFRSGIPVPISSETKLRLRTNAVHNHHGASSMGPVKARRATLDSPHDSPVVCRVSPQIVEGSAQEPSPPRSSGSESSGYFTPPPETQQAFVKLDTEEQSTSEVEATVRRINHQDSVESISSNHNEFLTSNLHQKGDFSVSSAETSDVPDVEEIPQPIRVVQVEDSLETSNYEVEEVTLQKHATPTSLDELDFIDTVPLNTDFGKSKSVADLKNFLPDIGVPTTRKNVNSAPPLNEDLNLTKNLANLTKHNFDDAPITPAKVFLPGSTECLEEELQVTKPAESCVETTARLPRRLGRSLSKRSIKSVTRAESTKSLRPFNKPKDALHQALMQMENCEWEVTVQGLQALTRVIQNHPEVVEAQMHAVCVGLAKHVRNLRSQVSRTACGTVTELFLTCKRGIDMEVEEVAAPLLQRTADTNRFLRADANSALDVMCDQLPPGRVIAVVTARGSCHQNAVVRAAAARLLNNIVTRLGPERVMQYPKDLRDRILVAGANALTDGNLDARRQAKAMMAVLVAHPQFQRALLDAVPQHVLRHIAKILNSLKPASGS